MQCRVAASPRVAFVRARPVVASRAQVAAAPCAEHPMSAEVDWQAYRSASPPVGLAGCMRACASGSERRRFRGRQFQRTRESAAAAEGKAAVASAAAELFVASRAWWLLRAPRSSGGDQCWPRAAGLAGVPRAVRATPAGPPVTTQRAKARDGSSSSTAAPHVHARGPLPSFHHSPPPIRRHEKDVGSTELQVAMLTARVKHLTEHLQANKKDHECTRGLMSVRAGCLCAGRAQTLL